MKLEDIKQVAVIGAGNMGAGIAELLSQIGMIQEKRECRCSMPR